MNIVWEIVHEDIIKGMLYGIISGRSAGWSLASAEEEEGEEGGCSFCAYLDYHPMKGNSEHLVYVLP